MGWGTILIMAVFAAAVLIGTPHLITGTTQAHTLVKTYLPYGIVAVLGMVVVFNLGKH